MHVFLYIMGIEIVRFMPIGGVWGFGRDGKLREESCEIPACYLKVKVYLGGTVLEGSGELELGNWEQGPNTGQKEARIE